jgi:AhpD family alkylhydroperoxidase
MSRQQGAFLPGLVPDALRGVETHIQGCGLEKSLIELVKMRASQINGCAFCLDMHSKDARLNGETAVFAECPEGGAFLCRTGTCGVGLAG